MYRADYSGNQTKHGAVRNPVPVGALFTSQSNCEGSAQTLYTHRVRVQLAIAVIIDYFALNLK